MADKAFIANSKDAETLRRVVAAVRKELLPELGSLTRLGNNADRTATSHHVADIYIALPQEEGGVPGLDHTGTSDEAQEGDEPGTAVCDIYTIDRSTAKIKIAFNDITVYNISTTSYPKDWLIVVREKINGRWICMGALEQDGGEDGDDGCCADCICEEDLTIDECGSVPELPPEFQISGMAPFPGGILSHVSGCIYETDGFAIELCDVDYGDYYWRLTVDEALDTSTLELINTTPGSGTPSAFTLLYKNKWHFDPMCGTRFGIVQRWTLPAEIAHEPPCEVCINAAGLLGACPACPSQNIIIPCCPDAPIPATLIATFVDDIDGRCSGFDGQTITLTYDPDLTPASPPDGYGSWYGSKSICGHTHEILIRCCPPVAPSPGVLGFLMDRSSTDDDCGLNATAAAAGGLLAYYTANPDSLGCSGDFASKLAPEAGGTACDPFRIEYVTASSGVTCDCCTGPPGASYHIIVTSP